MILFGRYIAHFSHCFSFIFFGCCFFFKPQIKLAEFEFCFAFFRLILSGNLVIIPLP